MSGLALAVLFPFIVALIIPFVHKAFRSVHTGWFVLIIPTMLVSYFASFMPRVWNFETVIETWSWVPTLGINFTLHLDGLSLLFALLITGIGALVVLYSIYYLPKKEPLHNFYVYLLMFMGAMLGVVLSDNMIVMYVFWEVTSISSFLLIGYWFHRQKSQYGAQKSLLITMAGGFSMLAGIVLLYTITGTFSVRETLQHAGAIVDSPFYIAIVILFLLGAFTKSAQFPFYIWLPDAMEAPTPVSAYLHSATMVKAGIYLIARMTPILGGTDQWFWTVSVVGLFTMVWASLMAIRQTDLKSILAYSTVSQLGLIIALLGYSSELAILAAMFHLFNHAAFKGSLFMVAGIVDHESGTRDIRRLGGLYALMPVTATLAFISAFAMAGIPPANGFLSKEMFFQASVDLTDGSAWLIIIPIAAFVGSIFTFIYSMILSFNVFTGQAQLNKLEQKPHEAPIGMLIPPVILTVVVLMVGIFPGLVANSVLAPVVEAIIPGTQPIVDITHWHGVNWPLLMTIGVFAVGTVGFIAVRKWTSMYEVLKQRDPLNLVYDTGMDGLVSGSQLVTRMQMTGVLRDYFLFMIVFILVALGYTLFTFDAFAIDFTGVGPVSVYFWVYAAIFIIATISIPFINNRMTLIIVTGVVGYLVALLFVMFRAPDLALTQLLIETVTVVLILLAFYHLPKLSKETFKPVFKWMNVIVSVGVGAAVTAIAFSSFAMRQTAGFESISRYYENAKQLAGGENMVNMILDDFRGLDTVLEVLVLGIAALGVFTMIKLRMKEGEDV